MRPIDADALSKAIEEAFRKAEDEGWKPGDVARTLCVIIAAPTLNLELVRYGHWVDKPSGRYGAWQSWCSACGKHSGIGGIESNRHKPYCPNCGARMDEEE